MKREGWLIVAVLAVGAAILGLFWNGLQTRQTVFDEGHRMQQLYVAISLYESQADGQLPLSLADARPYLARTGDYLSPADPFRAAPGPFPIDAGLPGSAPTSSFRISDAYLWAHRALGRIQTASWLEARSDPTLGVIANEWHGSVTPTQGFGANVSGEVLRITTEGAMVRVERGGPKPLGDAEDLFRAPAERR